MALNLLPMSALGAVESNGAVTFGLWLPWVSAGDGNAVTVKIIHEVDQFLAGVPAREFPLTHSVRPPYGDFWSATVPILGTGPAVPASAWGTPGRYVYRYTIVNPAAHFENRRIARRDHQGAALHRLQHGQPKTFVERWIHARARAGI